MKSLFSLATIFLLAGNPFSAKHSGIGFAVAQIPAECESNEATAGGTNPQCLICPPGEFSPDTVTEVDVAGNVLTCQNWSLAGICGLIPEDGGACAFVQFATGSCSCAPIPDSIGSPAPVAQTPAPVAPTPAPMVAAPTPTTAPGIPAECENDPRTAGGVEPPCLICPAGQISTDQTEIDIGGNVLTCQNWSIAGICGLIPDEGGACDFVLAATSACTCEPIPSEPSAPVVTPTVAPAIAPTFLPVLVPTFGPVAPPVPPPTPAPTRIPATPPPTTNPLTPPTFQPVGPPVNIPNPTFAPISLPPVTAPITLPNTGTPVGSTTLNPVALLPIFTSITPAPTEAGTTGTPTSAGSA